jgi:hypothetical protein
MPLVRVVQAIKLISGRPKRACASYFDLCLPLSLSPSSGKSTRVDGDGSGGELQIPWKRFAGPALTPGRVLVSFWPSFRCALWRALCAFFSPLGVALVVFCDPEHRFLGRYVAH